MTNLIGPLADLQCDTIQMSCTFVCDVDKHYELKFEDHKEVKTYLQTRLQAYISDVNIKFSGDMVAALCPSSWDKPADAKKINEGIGLAMAQAVTTMYTPRSSVEFPPGVSPQVKPKVILGESSKLIFAVYKAGVVTVFFKLHVHGIALVKPW